jgi:heme/copper-type cytochrome/quinol oxidase subunit 2
MPAAGKGEGPIRVTGTRHDFAHVQDLYLPVAAAVFAVIVVALVFVLVRYRARADRPPRRTRDRYDAGVAIALAVIVAVLVSVTLRTDDEETALARTGFRVDVVAFQWGWQFTYSTFDVRQAAKPVFGPAARALAQLPLAIGADGTLVAAGPLSGSVGPAWWSVKR